MTRIDLPREKKVKHLTLLRQPRPISGKEFNALSADERLMIVRAADSGQRYRLLIEATDGPELLARLPEQDLFLMLKEIGSDAIEDLIPMMTADQFTSCIDLDGWDGDAFQSERALFWLERLLECEPQTVHATIRDMNFEVLVLILKRHAGIVQGPETLNDEDNQVNALNRLGGYEVNFETERDSKLFSALFDTLFRLDPQFYTYLMEAARGEIDTLIEESVYQQRSDRLLDLGLPEPDAARGIYAWLDPDSFAPQQEKLAMHDAGEAMAPPAFMLAVSRPKNLLAAALDEGLSPAGCWELAFLSNKVLIANQVDVGERSAMQAALEEMFARLNLALEHLCGEDVERAVKLLDSAYFEHLFRVGYSLTLSLQRRARTLLDSATSSYFDAEDMAFLKALQRKPHPQFFTGLQQPGLDEERNFEQQFELDLAAGRLDQIELLVDLFENRLPFSLPEPDLDLPGCSPASTSDLDLTTLLLTALANRVMGRDFAPQPIAAEELGKLQHRICTEKALDPQLRSDTVAEIDRLCPGCGAFAAEALGNWEHNFCPIAPDALDPRYLHHLIIRLAD